jgi:hypothetical protein
MKRLGWSNFLLLILGLSLGSGAAQAEGARAAVPEYTMKAAYLYNFAQLTDWPVQPGVSDEVFSLCLFGSDEMLQALEPLRRKTIGGQGVRVQRITEASEARQCKVVYVGEGESNRGARLLEALRGLPILTVTDDPQAMRAGAVMLIIPEERRLTFEVNLGQARRSQLKLSSKLLGLARRIDGE